MSKHKFNPLEYLTKQNFLEMALLLPFVEKAQRLDDGPISIETLAIYHRLPIEKIRLGYAGFGAIMNPPKHREEPEGLFESGVDEDMIFITHTGISRYLELYKTAEDTADDMADVEHINNQRLQSLHEKLQSHSCILVGDLESELEDFLDRPAADLDRAPSHRKSKKRKASRKK